MPVIDHGVLVRRYDMHPALGRHQRLDARSLAYIHRHKGTVLKPIEHDVPIPVLDQEDLDKQGIHVSQVVPGAADVPALGSCTGNAGTAAYAILVGAGRELIAAGLSTFDAAGDERFAIRLYADGTAVDDCPGGMPGQDTGSSGLAIAQVLHKRGLIGGYRHALDADSLCSLLQDGAVMAGMPWPNAFFEPSAAGFVDATPGWAASGIAGGHEVCVIGLVKVVQDHAGRVIPDKTIIRVRNSWSKTWGLSGDFLMRLSTYNRLRAQIDLIQLTARKDAAR